MVIVDVKVMANADVVGEFRSHRHAVMIDHEHRAVEGLSEDLLGEDLSRRAVRNQSRVDACEPGELGGDRVQVVCGHDDRCARVIELEEEAQEIASRRDVYAHRRLVEQEQARFGQQRPGQEDPLALPSREISDMSRLEIAYADPLEDLMHLPLLG